MTWSLLLSVILSVVPPSLSVTLNSLSVPSFVETGSDVTLSCNYSYTESDKQELDIKWYLDDSPSPFLVWVPHQDRTPQIVGDKFRSHIDPGFTTGEDAYKLHSDIIIRNMTPQLAGIYTCKVASFTHEEYLSKRIIVLGQLLTFFYHIYGTNFLIPTFSAGKCLFTKNFSHIKFF